MRVLGISGSPRAGGNTEALLDQALRPFEEAGWEVRRFLLSDRTVAPCDGCDSCLDTGRCVIDDDMHVLYGGFAACDALIIGSPVYYRNVSAQLKAVFDRSYPLAKTHLLAGKVGGAIAVGRGQGAGQSLVLTIIYNYFLSSEAICVPGEINGVSAVADKPGDVLTQPKRLNQARALGENVLRWASLAERLAAAKP